MSNTLQITDAARDCAVDIKHRIIDHMFTQAFCEERVQLAIDSVCVDSDKEIERLKESAANSDKAYKTVKEWAHRLEAQLEHLLDQCCDHADGAPDATDLAKFCNEMIGVSNGIMLKDIQTIRAQRDTLLAREKELREIAKEFSRCLVLKDENKIGYVDGYMFREALTHYTSFLAAHPEK